MDKQHSSPAGDPPVFRRPAPGGMRSEAQCPQKGRQSLPNTYAGLRAQSQVLADEMLRVVREKLLSPLVAALDAHAIWIFGSVARGEPSRDSDCDILVISGEAVNALAWKKRWNLGYDAISDAALPFHCDLVVWSEQELSEKQSGNSRFFQEIASQKRVIYER